MQPRPVLSSVVKVLTVSDAPDYEQPWQTQGATNSSGSGAIVKTKRGLRVLSNAHVVQNQVHLQVRRYGSSEKFIAEVEGVGHECDLALLRVPDKRFFARAQPIEISKLPQLSDRVAVCGYPIGGDRLSITEGVVSRIEVSSYAQSQRPLLAIQIDAAINAGNSGGPIFMGNKLAGVAFQALDEGQNIAYAIAPSVVRHFLRDLDEGGYRGFPDLGIWWQRLESPAHRSAIQLKERQGGVVVTRIAFEGSAWGVLYPGDVILRVEGTKIGADGTVPLREGELIDFSHLIADRYMGESVTMEIWRDGKRLTLDVPLKGPVHLVPDDRYDVRPTYYIYAGILFVPLTRDYLKSWGSEWWKNAPHDLIALYEGGIRTEDREDVVVIQKVLADRANLGYHDYENLVVEQVNGTPVRSMRHMIELIETFRGDFLELRTQFGRRIVLDRALAEERNQQLLGLYHVPADRSLDLASTRRRRRPAKKAPAKKTSPKKGNAASKPRTNGRAPRIRASR